MGKGLFLAEGDMWKKHRKVVSFAFHYNYLQKMIPYIVSITNDHYKSLIKDKKLNNVDILNEF
jgi:cytochrome P450